MAKEFYKCPMCERKHIKDHMTFHHLLPSAKGEGKGEPTIYICKTCHVVVHDCYTNKELREQYNTIEAILSSKKIQQMLKLYIDKPDNCIFKIKKLRRLAYK